MNDDVGDDGYQRPIRFVLAILSAASYDQDNDGFVLAQRPYRSCLANNNGFGLVIRHRIVEPTRLMLRGLIMKPVIEEEIFVLPVYQYILGPTSVRRAMSKRITMALGYPKPNRRDIGAFCKSKVLRDCQPLRSPDSRSPDLIFDAQSLVKRPP